MAPYPDDARGGRQPTPTIKPAAATSAAVTPRLSARAWVGDTSYGAPPGTAFGPPRGACAKGAAITIPTQNNALSGSWLPPCFCNSPSYSLLKEIERLRSTEE